MNLTEIIQSKNEGKTLSKIDEMRYNFITQRLDEEVYKGYIIAYHRTKDAEQFMNISNKIGFSTLGEGGGDMYGVGLYGNYTWSGVNTDYSKSAYGNYIVKYIVKPNNVLFFDEYTQVKVYGKKMSLIEQCDYWGIIIPSKIKFRIKNIDVQMKSENEKYTSGYAFDFYNLILKRLDSRIKSQIYGISYNGSNDRETILMYDFRNLTILGYYHIDDTFHKIGNHNFYNIKSVSKNINKNSNPDNLITPKDYHKPDYILDKTENKIVDKNRKLKIPLYKFEGLSLDEKYKLFDKYYNMLSDKSESYDAFINLFLSNPYNYKKDYNGIIYQADDGNCNISNVKLSKMPFKLVKSNCEVQLIYSNFTDLTFMFDRIYQGLLISRCNYLTSLNGIQNMKFDAYSNKNSTYITLNSLPLLQSLKFLPDNVSRLRLFDCPLIDLNEISKHKHITLLSVDSCENVNMSHLLPPNIEYLYYEDENPSIDLNLLSNYKKLKFVMINNKTLTFDSNTKKWHF